LGRVDHLSRGARLRAGRQLADDVAAGEAPGAAAGAVAPERFAALLYEGVLRRPGSAEEVAGVAGMLRGGHDPARLLEIFATSEEFRRAAPAAAPSVPAERTAASLYRGVLRRLGSAAEIDGVAAMLRGGHELARLLETFVASDEFRRSSRDERLLAFPPGHYYSPVVDPATLDARTRRVLTSRRGLVAAIDLDLAGQRRLLEEFAAAFAKIPFTDKPSPGRRYHYDNPYFRYGDGIVLFAMIDRLRPRRIVEVGAGFSSACMLDAIDACGLADPHYTLIDPDLERVTGLLAPADRARVEIVGRPVQETPPEVFATLGAGDILFIDSTHVAKTGSDVLFEVFEVLPRLAAGVMIHFHDCTYPFEYPAHLGAGREPLVERALPAARLPDVQPELQDPLLQRLHLRRGARVGRAADAGDPEGAGRIAVDREAVAAARGTGGRGPRPRREPMK
jgi:hypothetical protein